MKIAVISDIHANVMALKTFFDDIVDEDVAYILNAGDSLSVGPHPKAVLDLLFKDNRVKSILGNNDLCVLGTPGISKFSEAYAEATLRSIGAYHEERFRQLPLVFSLDIKHRSLYMTHSMPFDTYTLPPLYQGKGIMAYFDAYPKAHIIIHGHTHQQLLIHHPTEQRIILNPGSLGLAPGAMLQYAMIHLEEEAQWVELRQVPYDKKSVVDEVKKTKIDREIALSFFEEVFQ